ncbi:unnamed protein product, partial [Choristocarpus tenellus]
VHNGASGLASHGLPSNTDQPIEREGRQEDIPERQVNTTPVNVFSLEFFVRGIEKIREKMMLTTYLSNGEIWTRAARLCHNSFGWRAGVNVASGCCMALVEQVISAWKKSVYFFEANKLNLHVQAVLGAGIDIEGNTGSNPEKVVPSSVEEEQMALQASNHFPTKSSHHGWYTHKNLPTMTHT